MEKLRNVKTKPYIYILTLTALVFSTISGASEAIEYFQWKLQENESKYIERYHSTKENSVTCQPQTPERITQLPLWTCQDSYGNIYKNLRITQAN